MRWRNYLVAGLASLALGSGSAFGQTKGIDAGGQSDFKVADRVQIVEPGPPLDTRKFFPQVDTSRVSLREFRIPKNHLIQFPEEPVPDKSPVGFLNGKTQGTAMTAFPGMEATGWNPPDVDVAVGPSHIVQVVNSSFAFFQKNGTKDFEQTSEVFFAGLGAGTFQFDPKVIYDRVNQRFVILNLEQSTSPTTSKLLIAISDDSNPNGTWFRYRVEAKINVSGTEYWLDYPGFGYNKDAIVISGNMFNFSNTAAYGTQFVVIRTSSILSGGAATVSSILHQSQFSTQVAEMISPTFDRIYAINRSGSNSYRIYSLADLTGTPTSTTTTFSVTANTAPSIDAQSTNSRTLDSLDGRIFTAMWRNGRMVVSHNAEAVVSGTNRVVSRFTEINTNDYPNSTPTERQAVILSSAGQHIHMPATAFNNAGDTIVVASRSSTAIAADIVTYSRLGSDALNTFGALTLHESSAGSNYTGGRWGDYFGADVDPTDDGLFWVTAQKIRSDNNWQTSIFSVRLSQPVALDSVVASPTNIRSRQNIKLTAFLTANATSNTNGTIQVDIPGVTSVSYNVTIPSGSNSISVPFTVPQVGRSTPMTVTANFLSSSKTANYLIRP